MTDNTSTSKTDVENWRRGYEAALRGKAFVRVSDEKTSAWRLGYRDGRALRRKQRVEAKRAEMAEILAVARLSAEYPRPPGPD